MNSEYRIDKLERFLRLCGFSVDEIGTLHANDFEIDKATVQGWRTHCTSGEKRNGELRADFQDYALGFQDGFLAGQARRHGPRSLSTRTEAEAFREPAWK
jgi:hypothetical protein